MDKELHSVAEQELLQMEQTIEAYLNSSSKKTGVAYAKLFTLENLERLIFSIREARRALEDIADFWTDSDKYPDGAWSMQETARKYLKSIGHDEWKDYNVEQY